MRLARDRFSIDAAVAKNRELPQWYLDEPLIQHTDQFYLQSFRDLHTCRTSGMSLGPIPWRDIVTYGSWYGLEPDILDSFIFIMRSMDCAYLEWADKEAEKSRENNG